MTSRRGSSAMLRQNVIVHKEAGRFGGWPANNGIWSWGNEIVVGFKLGYFKPNDHGHAIRRPHLEDGDALIQRRRRRRKDRVPRYAPAAWTSPIRTRPWRSAWFRAKAAAIHAS